MPSPFNRAGYENLRNYAKPFKAVTTMPNGNMNSQQKLAKKLGNGCSGWKSRFGISIKVYGPQKGKRRERKRKSTCRLVSKLKINAVADERLRAMISLRGQIKTIQIVEDFLGKAILPKEIAKQVPVISQEIMVKLTAEEREEIFGQDNQRDLSVTGRLRSDGVKTVRIDKIINRIRDAIRYLFPPDRKPAFYGQCPHQTKTTPCFSTEDSYANK